jgi:hypothetical protein
VPAAPGPGPVAAVHRITIVTALLGAIAYFAWEVNQVLSGDGPLAVLRAVVAFAVVIGIGLYLRSLRGLAAKLTPRH